MASSRYFVREKVTRLVFRDDKGRFVSKESAIRKGILPVESSYEVFRDKRGRMVSRDKVKRSKRKIVDVVRGKDGILRTGEGLLIGGKKIPDPVFGEILGQQMRGKLSESISNGDRIGFIYKGRFYPVLPTMYGKIQDAWILLSNLAVKVFKEGDSLYYVVPIAEGPDSLVMDFDGILPSEMDKDGPEFNALKREFYRSADLLLKDFIT